MLVCSRGWLSPPTHLLNFFFFFLKSREEKETFISINIFNFIFQIPDSVVDRKSSAFNKGRVFIQGANEATTSAYKKQFQTDLSGFMRSRAQEMMSGGFMFLVCLGRTSVDPTDQGGAGLLFGTHFQDAWNDLVLEVIMHIHSFPKNFNLCVKCQTAHTLERTNHFPPLDCGHCLIWPSTVHLDVGSMMRGGVGPSLWAVS